MTEPITPPAGDPPKDPPAVPHLQKPPEDPPAPQDPPKPSPPAKDGDQPLGENGLKALQAERERANEFEKRLKALAPLEKIAAALGEGDPVKGKSELEQLAERQANFEKELSSERQARWKLEAINEHKLPPEWADRLHGATREELLVDAEALAKLIPTKPASQFQGSGDGGVREQGVAKSQLTRADLKGMTSSQIEAARKEGRLDELMGIK